GLDAGGDIVAWRQRIVGQSILAGLPKPPPPDKLDRTCVEGASTLPYAIPNLTVESHQPALPVPVLWWRSVGHTHTAFSTECFLDELAHASGRDPLALRRALIVDDPRRLAVLELAAAQAGWGTPLGPRRGRGIAVHHSFKTWVAEVAEVTLLDDGDFRVDRVVIAVDCGIVVNPGIVRAQMEGGVGYALSALRGEAVTLVDGVVQEDNFDTYPLLRLSQMPAIEVHIVPSREHPSGVGEPAVPPLAPAVANALFAASGKRLRRLPLRGTQPA
ncbi:MAG: xanthine dehydrogenase family protein molybdopterin-binding subunit, partial [Gammaproteobacteria bacterium]